MIQPFENRRRFHGQRRDSSSECELNALEAMNNLPASLTAMYTDVNSSLSLIMHHCLLEPLKIPLIEW
ncbi:MAG: hypothetical protein CMM07_04795 [Rhodopirellula sp.]|nr:hypothetical protein [Rhodopirellula sp.]